MTDSARRRRRTLRPDEAALWRKVAESIEPMAGRRLPAAPEPAAAPEKAVAPAPAASAPARPATAAAKRRAPLAPLDTRLRQRLSRGQVDVDLRIDLHGLRQAEAHRRLLAFLGSAQAHGARVVLVITGKGRTERGEGFGEGPGVLRRQVPLWLAAPELRAIVVGFEEAAPTHGGAGALYVRVRRKRPSSI